MSATDNLNLPIIDLRELDNENTRADFYKKLRKVSRENGFFYLVGHGISQEERDDLLNTVKRFFALPQDAKDKISIDNSPHFHGYTRTGDERTRNKADFREQLDIGEEVVGQTLLAEDDPHFYRNLRGPNQWPEEVPELKGKALAYADKAHHVLSKLLKAFIGALEVPEEDFSVLTTDTGFTLKLVHYPANDGEQGPDRQQGCGPHKDAALLALLWQDDVGGLQVFTEEKGWIDAPSVKDAYIVNIGEILELATNGYFTADIHQVVMKPHLKKDRYSIPFFLSTGIDLDYLPLLKLPKELQAEARGPSSDPENPLFQNVSRNYMKARLRSHLNTTKRFYPKSYEQIVKSGNISSSAY
ncbi:non-haem dioxygenase in morphine synthesis N-terminal/2OG-Fe(II) oxygenase superfamily, putative [Angomonas deanei]|uniref:Non-haem dioxygenase in morphine synthesis N-terminal/2OG-Fe(II) oxygenase superfamily, putative n=1 Tax=Angomonas deanei TaxID=59799 RepID=A0A7G2CUW8_9TRYP|nr:non-haem dioxygenase in morphine synthesis N-terminal/2OG-Fe(II) oxygenase superfamily, putative [Angomonas deanei]